MLPTQGPFHYAADNAFQDILLCPSCGSDHAHVDAVTAIAASGDRWTLKAEGEDEKSHVQVIDDSGVAASPGRRHVIALLLRCEDCLDVTALTFQQHKGQTFVRSEPQPALRSDNA